MGQRKLEQVQIDLFRDEGFLALPTIFDVAATQEVQQLLDPLLQDFHKLPEGELRGEVNRALRMEPRLTHSTVYRTCQAFAKQLIGRHAAYSFDHAIYKLPYSDHETPWHQDQAYMGHPVSFNTVHFWVPLQDVTERNGCMQFALHAYETVSAAH